MSLIGLGKKTYALDKYFNMILWKFDPLSKNVFFLNHYIHLPLDQTHLLEARQTIATFFFIIAKKATSNELHMH